MEPGAQHHVGGMSLLHLVLLLVVVGVLLWLANTYIPMQPTMKRIVNGVAIIVVVIFLLQVFGLLPDLQALHVGRVGR